MKPHSHVSVVLAIPAGPDKPPTSHHSLRWRKSREFYVDNTVGQSGQPEEHDSVLVFQFIVEYLDLLQIENQVVMRQPISWQPEAEKCPGGYSEMGLCPSSESSDELGLEELDLSLNDPLIHAELAVSSALDIKAGAILREPSHKVCSNSISCHSPLSLCPCKPGRPKLAVTKELPATSNHKGQLGALE